MKIWRTLNQLDVIIEGELIRDIWRSFLGAVIRFWDNRFQKNDEALSILKLELERERLEKNKILNSLLEQLNSKAVETEEVDVSQLKSLGKSNWRVRARFLEERSRKERANMTSAPVKVTDDIDSLEKELGIENANL